MNFFPHNKLKKTQPKTSYCLCLESSLWRAVTMDSTRFSPGSCTHVDEEDETPEQFRDVLVSQGCYTAFCELRAQDHRNLFPEILKAYKSELEVSAVSLWATRRILLASSSWQSLGFLAARLHPPISALLSRGLLPASSCGLPLCVCLSSSTPDLPGHTPMWEASIIIWIISAKTSISRKATAPREQGLGL